MTRSKSEQLGDTFIFVSIFVLNVMILYPFYYTLINSVNDRLFLGPSLVWPAKFTLYPYKLVFSNPLILQAFFITISRTVVGLLLTTLNCGMAAFALRKSHVQFRRLYIAILLIPTFFQGGLIPTYLNYRNLHLLDTFLVYVLPRMFHFFYLVVMMSAFNDISDSLEESAKMDGAGYFTIFYRIYLPLSLPILATVALFEGVEQWNSWFDSVYFTTSNSLVTLAAFLLRIVKEADLWMYNYDIAKDMGTRNLEGLKLAVMVVSIVPIALIYPFFQRYFVKGVSLGSLKE